MIGKLSGHTQVQTTVRYAHACREGSPAVRRFGAALKRSVLIRRQGM